MKKVICLASALMMVLMGCSGSVDEGWPEEIKGKDYMATRIDTVLPVSYRGMEISYDNSPEEDIVKNSSLIARISIMEDPVEYSIKHLYGGNEVSKPMMAYSGVIQKVYYTDENVREGETVQFLRQEFMQSKTESGVMRFYDSVTIQLGKGEYILFLEDYSLLKKEMKKFVEEFGPTNVYDAFKAVAPYFSTDPCRTIIFCEKDNMYTFDQAFKSLREGATESSLDVGMLWYQKQDDNFDEDIQAMVNQYKK